ncbi:hypothetical protein MCHUDSM44219_01076 [Mycolicibacterium chubuense]|uniref:Uncharacterized protein n=1 Tax=Mycolicibacterium chubuense TaxID=1800 RepID=A0A0J6WNL4_MYCCU|nr:hypothetical protein MCHUDSM44219_01076 [Mycolicibacterium chubuense]
MLRGSLAQTPSIMARMRRSAAMPSAAINRPHTEVVSAPSSWAPMWKSRSRSAMAVSRTASGS